MSLITLVIAEYWSSRTEAIGARKLLRGIPEVNFIPQLHRKTSRGNKPEGSEPVSTENKNAMSLRTWHAEFNG
jgi:hypothetical protein